MESLDFQVAASVAAPIKFALISLFGVFSQERKAVRAFSCVIVLATLTGAIAFSSNVSGAEAPLTLAEAQRRAVERSRQTAAQDAAVAASREMAVAAGQLPDPVLTLGIENLPIDGPDQFSLTRDFMTMRRIGVMQEFTRSEKRKLRAQRFEREAEKSLVERTAAVATIQRDTALAWLDRYYAEASAAVIAQQAGEAKLEIEAAEGAYRAGRGNQADVFAAHSALVGFEDRASEIDRQIRTARINTGPLDRRGSRRPLSGKPAIDSIRLDTRALDTQLAHHPEISVLAKQEEIASTEARLAQAEKKADWSMGLIYSQRGPAYSNMVSIGVSIPLQWDQRTVRTGSSQPSSRWSSRPRRSARRHCALTSAKCGR